MLWIRLALFVFALLLILAVAGPWLLERWRERRSPVGRLLARRYDPHAAPYGDLPYTNLPYGEWPYRGERQ